MKIEVRGGLTPLLQVFHMPTSLRFYRNTLGFNVAASSPALSSDADDVGWVMLELNDAVLMLNTAYDPEDTPDAPDHARWSGHQDTGLYIGCPDVDGAYAFLRAKGVEVTEPNVTGYGMKQIYLKDPDGFGICFQWRADRPVAQPGDRDA
jgi:catechol 2,3-dioxygenase-like lactoylglutathione lyase family enzyme